jgi:hypothetical protein
MNKHGDGVPDFSTPLDIPPPEQAHDHDWQFVEIAEGANIYETNIDDYQSFSEYMSQRNILGVHPDTAIFICICGQKKSVEVKE